MRILNNLRKSMSNLVAPIGFPTTNRLIFLTLTQPLVCLPLSSNLFRNSAYFMIILLLSIILPVSSAKSLDVIFLIAIWNILDKMFRPNFCLHLSTITLFPQSRSFSNISSTFSTFTKGISACMSWWVTSSGMFG